MSENQTGALLVRLTSEEIKAVLEGPRTEPVNRVPRCVGCGLRTGIMHHAHDCPELRRVEAALAKLRGEHLTVAAVLEATKGRPVVQDNGLKRECCGTPYWCTDPCEPNCPTLAAQAEHDATVARLEAISHE